MVFWVDERVKVRRGEDDRDAFAVLLLLLLTSVCLLWEHAGPIWALLGHLERDDRSGRDVGAAAVVALEIHRIRIPVVRRRNWPYVL